jgi:hypothetical protein
MSESIAEMVIPGTYIEVRAEGLIGVGGIVTGNIGIVGTAARGPVNEVRILSSMADAVDAFGLADPFTEPREAGQGLTLVRTLQQAFEGGARNVLAVRAANGDTLPATLKIENATKTDGFEVSAKGHFDSKGAAIANSSGTWGRDIELRLEEDGTSFRLTETYRKISKVYSGATMEELHKALGESPLLSVGTLKAAIKGDKPAPFPKTKLAGGQDGATVSVDDLKNALEKLEDQPVNILLVAGKSAKKIGNAVQGHLQRTLDQGRERIAILGADVPGKAGDVKDVVEEAGGLENDRVVFVAPGMMDGDDVLPPSYLAAVVAGKLSTLAPHVSLTNKTLPATVDVRYSTGAVTTLLGEQVLVVRQKYGTQVVRGLTTSAPPFSQISVRRTVDYAKAGVRLGSDPYIGRLNNARVRAALQATLDGFLSQMVLDEMLTGYELSVTATRAQEIAGICSVVMNLKPTFSIDYIRVTMNLE